MRTYRQKRCCWRKTGEAQGFGTGVRPVKDVAGSLVPGDRHQLSLRTLSSAFSFPAPLAGGRKRMFVASLQGSIPDGGKVRYLACWVSAKGTLLSGSAPAGWQGKAEVRTFRYSGAGGPGCADGRFSAASGILLCFDIAFIWLDMYLFAITHRSLRICNTRFNNWYICTDR